MTVPMLLFSFVVDFYIWCPSLSLDTTLTGAGIFSQKSFVICDFEPEHEEHLNRMIKENGGNV